MVRLERIVVMGLLALVGCSQDSESVSKTQEKLPTCPEINDRYNQQHSEPKIGDYKNLYGRVVQVQPSSSIYTFCNVDSETAFQAAQIVSANIPFDYVFVRGNDRRTYIFISSRRAVPIGPAEVIYGPFENGGISKEALIRFVSINQLPPDLSPDSTRTIFADGIITELRPKIKQPTEEGD